MVLFQGQIYKSALSTLTYILFSGHLDNFEYNRMYIVRERYQTEAGMDFGAPIWAIPSPGIRPIYP